MTELATLDAPVVDVDYWTESLVFAARVAEKVADTEFVATSLRGRPEAVAATILYGLEVGVTPMQALQGIHIVEGRPAPSAELMRALVLRAGHTITVHEATGTRVRVSGLRRGRPESERLPIEWSLDMARSAGLLGKRNWQTYPRAMLLARATGDLCRIVFPDVIKGLGYVAEDASVGDVFGLPETVPEKPARRALQRSRAPQPPQVDLDTGGQLEEPVTAPADPRREPPDRTSMGGRASGQASPEDVAWQRPLTPDDVAERPSSRAWVDVPLPEMPPDAATPPEPPPSAADAPDVAPALRLIAPAPLKAIHTGIAKQLGSVVTREERLSLISAIVGRVVDSSKHLTRSEGYRVLDYLDRFETGAAAYVLDPDTGQIAVHDVRDAPPPDE